MPKSWMRGLALNWPVSCAASWVAGRRLSRSDGRVSQGNVGSGVLRLGTEQFRCGGTAEHLCRDCSQPSSRDGRGREVEPEANSPDLSLRLPPTSTLITAPASLSVRYVPEKFTRNAPYLRASWQDDAFLVAHPVHSAAKDHRRAKAWAEISSVCPTTAR